MGPWEAPVDTAGAVRQTGPLPAEGAVVREGAQTGPPAGPRQAHLRVAPTPPQELLPWEGIALAVAYLQAGSTTLSPGAWRPSRSRGGHEKIAIDKNFFKELQKLGWVGRAEREEA